MIQNKVLVFLPSNFGDILLALKAIDLIKQINNSYELYALCSPHTYEFVNSLGFFKKTEIFDKTWSLSTKIKYLSTFRNKFEICIDFKHSLLPMIVNSPVHTPMIRFACKGHKSKNYIDIVKKTFKVNEMSFNKRTPYIPDQKSDFAMLDDDSKYIFIAAGTKSALKSYPAKLWAEFIDNLNTDKKIIFVGAEEDKVFVDSIMSQLNADKLKVVINLIGKTSFLDLFHLLATYAQVLICCDSAPLHVANYINIPIIAMFGPTDPILYGPVSDNSVYIQATKASCLACMKPRCKHSNTCMEMITPQQIIEQYEKI